MKILTWPSWSSGSILGFIFFLSSNRPSRAGEEEFYFDDVNVDSHTTSGASSNSSNENLAETPTNESARNTGGSIDHSRSKAINIPNIPINIPTVIISPHPPASAGLFDSGPPQFVHGNYLSRLDADASQASKKIKPFIPIREPHLIAKSIQSPNFNMDFLNTQPSTPTGNESLPVLTKAPADNKTLKRRKGSGKKKCRKVYGMSNKGLWCNQCRWKKACARFLWTDFLLLFCCFINSVYFFVL